MLDHEVVAAEGLDEDAEAALTHNDDLEFVPTLGELVDQLVEALEDGADKTALRIDDDGNPTLIEIDYDENAIDDEACYAITEFRLGE